MSTAPVITPLPTDSPRARARACTLPWLPSPPETPSDPLATYLTEAAALIGTRAEMLADAVVRDAPGWAMSLGVPPEDPERYALWRRQVEIIAAYRDQQRITLDDPRHILGGSQTPTIPPS